MQRIWRRACQAAGATEPVTAKLPRNFEVAQQVVDAIFSAATDRTRLVVVSHITSPTAIILPVQKICAEARRRGIAVCIDGPHAPAQVPISLDELSCDFYTASLHKWASAPLGSGFLYVGATMAGTCSHADIKLGPSCTYQTHGVVGGIRLDWH